MMKVTTENLFRLYFKTRSVAGMEEPAEEEDDETHTDTCVPDNLLSKAILSATPANLSNNMQVSKVLWFVALMNLKFNRKNFDPIGKLW